MKIFQRNKHPSKAGETGPPATLSVPADAAGTEQWLGRLKRGLSRTSSQLAGGVGNLFLGRKEIDAELLEELEAQLLTADAGVEASVEIVQRLTERVTRKELEDAGALYTALQQELQELLAGCEQPLRVAADQAPFVILMAGVNGAGKTTTIGKLAQWFQAQGKSVMLAAGDTFRAAAVEQLRVWGERNAVPVIAQHSGADSAAVIFDAVQAARARGVDVLIADTAGRLHNNSNLMEELKKSGSRGRQAGPYGAPRGHAGAGCRRRAKCPVPGQTVPRGGGGYRNHPGQAGWNRQGRYYLCHCPPTRFAHPLYRSGGIRGRFAALCGQGFCRSPVFRWCCKVIRFERVSKRYPQGHTVLDEVSFTVDSGELVFLTGRSGAGKTTLLKLIILLERPSRGQIQVNGQNLTGLSLRKIPRLRRNIGVVFQDHQLLFDRSIFDNVALPLRIAGCPRRELGRRARAALDKVGLLSRERDMPITLSGGEQQRVGIARAVVNKPSLLLADEPTGNLDPELSAEIMSLLVQFSQAGTTVLVASHDLALISRMRHRIMTLRDGRMLTASGEH